MATTGKNSGSSGRGRKGGCPLRPQPQSPLQQHYQHHPRQPRGQAAGLTPPRARWITDGTPAIPRRCAADAQSSGITTPSRGAGSQRPTDPRGLEAPEGRDTPPRGRGAQHRADRAQRSGAREGEGAGCNVLKLRVEDPHGD